MTEVLAILAILALAGAVVWHAYRAEVSTRQQTTRSFHSDLTHVTILVNTMRDLLQQQKDLARQFNENLDRKSAAVRQLASVASENLEQLRDTKRQVLEELEEAREELASLHQQAEYLRERTERSQAIAPAPAPELRPEEPLAPPPVKAPRARSTGMRKSKLGAKRTKEPADSVSASAAAEEEPPVAFTGPRPGQFPAAAPEPVEPEEDMSGLPIEYSESSREALRSLLGLERPGVLSLAERSVLGDSPVVPVSGANGKGFPTSVRTQVEEYHKAGMSQTEIARELGLGKGEVRLILNLGKDR